MTLQSSGSLSLSQVQSEHGGSLPLSMSSLLRGNASKIIHANNIAVPAAAPMSLNQFYGTSRFGYYPITVGVSGTSAENNRQFGANTGSVGAFFYNNKYRGYNIGWFLWNEYDNVFGISLAGINIPQSILTSFGTALSGAKTPTGYVGNFYGFSVWNVTLGFNPFTSVGTTDNSLFIL